MYIEVTERQVVVWRSWITVIHVLAISSGFFRLYRQRKLSRMWWDDYFAAIALAVEFGQSGTRALNLISFSEDYEVTTSKEAIISQIATSWIVDSVFWTLLWSTRISFALSIARFIPPGTFPYKTAIALSGIFFAILVTCTSYMTVECVKTYSTWSKEIPYECILPSWIPVLLAFDFFADISLVAVSAWAFWGELKLAQTARRLIQACFASTSITAAWNIIYTIVLTLSGKLAQWNRHGSNSLMLVTFQPYIVGPISLLVCNVLIVVTSLYRLFQEESKPVVVMPSASNVDSGPQSNGAESSGIGRTISTLSGPEPYQSGRQSFSDPESSRLELTELYESDITVPSSAWTDIS